MKRPQPTRRCWWVAFVALLASACGRDVDLGEDDPDRADFDDLVSRVAEVRCQGNSACCEDAERIFETPEDCVAHERREALELGTAAFDDGRIVIDAAGADALVERLEDEVELCAVPPGYSAYPLRGTVEEGGDCSAGPLDPSPLLSCAPGLYCDATADPDGSRTGACRVLAASGDPCRDAELMGPCEAGLYCDAQGPGEQGVCQPRKPAGAPCSESRECESGFCDDCPEGLCDNPDACAVLEPIDAASYYCFGPG